MFPHEKVSLDLVRFYRAKKGNVDDATVKATNYYRWTQTARPDLIDGHEIEDELDSGKCLYMCKDLKGRPGKRNESSVQVIVLVMLMGDGDGDDYND